MNYYITDEQYAIAKNNGIYPELVTARVRDYGWKIERAII